MKKRGECLTNTNKNYLRIGFVLLLLIAIAIICERVNTDSVLRTINGILLGLIRSSIYRFACCVEIFCACEDRSEEHPKIFIGSCLLPHPVDGYQDG